MPDFSFFNPPKQIPHLHFERLSQQQQTRQRYVHFATLERTDLGTMDPSFRFAHRPLQG